MSIAAGSIVMGLADPVRDAQAVFRAVLTAMSEPGREIECPALPECPLSPVTAAVALTLCDFETPVFLAGSLARDDIRAFLSFHTGAPFSDPETASFVIANGVDELPPLRTLPAGTPDYPDRSATLIVGVSDFTSGQEVALKGPGILDVLMFRSGGLGAEFWRDAIANASRFPLGVDFIFCGPRSLAGLPRSTAIAFHDGL